MLVSSGMYLIFGPVPPVSDDIHNSLKNGLDFFVVIKISERFCHAFVIYVYVVHFSGRDAVQLLNFDFGINVIDQCSYGKEFRLLLVV